MLWRPVKHRIECDTAVVSAHFMYCADLYLMLNGRIQLLVEPRSMLGISVRAHVHHQQKSLSVAQLPRVRPDTADEELVRVSESNSSS